MEKPINLEFSIQWKYVSTNTASLCETVEELLQADEKGYQLEIETFMQE